MRLLNARFRLCLMVTFLFLYSCGDTTNTGTMLGANPDGGGSGGGSITNFSLSGTLLSNNLPIQGVTVTLTGDNTIATTTDTSGNYRFFVQNGNFSVIVQTSAYMSNPTRKDIQVSGANVGNVNFVLYPYESLIIPATDTTYWRWRNPTPTGNIIRDITYNGSKLIAVGDIGSVSVSSDAGNTWSSINNITNADLTGVACDNVNTCVAIGDNGIILISNDRGSSWKSRKLSTDTTDSGLTGIAYGNGMFVVVSESRYVFLSNDGDLKWIKIRPLINTAFYSSSNILKFADGKFVSTTGRYESTDGFTWTQIFPSGITGSLYDLSYANSIWVGVGSPGGSGGIYTSSNFLDWVSHPTGGSNISGIFGVTYLNGKFIAIGASLPNDSSQVFISTNNGINWSASNVNEEGNYTNIVGAGTNIIIGGYDGKIATTDINNTSTWTRRNNIITSSYIRGIDFGQGTFAAVTWDNGIITSIDNGISWQYKTAPISYLYNIVFDNGTFLALKGPSGGLKSIDYGMTWTGVNMPGYPVNDVTYGNGLWIGTLEQYGILTISNDGGNNWSTITTPSSSMFNGISYGNGKFVAVGNQGAIITSTDGTNWNIESSGITGELADVAFGNGLFISVSSDQNVLTSSDGTNWQLQNPLSSSGGIKRIRYKSGKFIVTGMNKLFITNDGLSWEIINTPYSSLTDSTYDGVNIISVGSQGTIITTTK